MSFKIGLKLWSTNTDCYFDEAKRLYHDGVFDYIELYVVPDTLAYLDKWKSLDVPFSLHAPHFMHEVNLADPVKLEYNQSIFRQVEEYRHVLKAKYTVVHGGMNGCIEETIRQLKIIAPQNMLIENKPYRAPLVSQALYRGAVIEEVRQVLNEINCGFCLDIGHAICVANNLEQEPYSFIQQYNTLKPLAYHLSDNLIDSMQDQHLNFGHGSFDFSRIFSIIDHNKYLLIETKKSNPKNLNDFCEDVGFLSKKL